MSKHEPDVTQGTAGCSKPKVAGCTEQAMWTTPAPGSNQTHLVAICEVELESSHAQLSRDYGLHPARLPRRRARRCAAQGLLLPGPSLQRSSVWGTNCVEMYPGCAEALKTQCAGVLCELYAQHA